MSETKVKPIQVEELLREITAISEKYDAIYKKTGGYFNIFNIANIEYDEVKICRVIAELIDPKGSHCQGSKYLRIFTETVLGLTSQYGNNFSDEEFNEANVYREYPIDGEKSDGKRRIDIVIETKQRFIPIEVKIYASDQDRQCKDYYNFAKRKMSKSEFLPSMYYLSIDGRMPDESSWPKKSEKNEVEYDKLVTLNFPNHIVTWLKECLCDSDTIKMAPIREVIQQFIGTIQKLSNRMEEGKMVEIVEKISESEKNMLAAVATRDSINEAAIVMMKKLFVAVGEKVSGKNYHEGIYGESFCESKKIDAYFNFAKVWPGKNFSCGYVDCAEKCVEIKVRLEINGTNRGDLYAGYCLIAEGGEKAERDKITQDAKIKIRDTISNHLNKSNTKVNESYYWSHYENIKIGENEICFRSFNEGFCKLFDLIEFDDAVEKIAKKLKYFLEIPANETFVKRGFDE
ncbi:MAG: PD-(D/E)XK nuclease family protein [Anaerovoracaceae bacterium]